jgi:murein DD-endopeptidase MepM/ murein hydrolase activator NlpD
MLVLLLKEQGGPKKIFKYMKKTYYFLILGILLIVFLFWPAGKIINPIESNRINYNPKSFWHPWGDHMHRGIDIFADTGTPIRCAKSGLVIRTIKANDDSPNPYQGGNAVDILGMGGRVYHYSHMSKILARPFTFVSQGEIIGLVGRTGNASRPGCPPHCHFSIFRIIPDYSESEKEHPHYVNPVEVINNNKNNE